MEMVECKFLWSKLRTPAPQETGGPWAGRKGPGSMGAVLMFLRRKPMRFWNTCNTILWRCTFPALCSRPHLIFLLSFPSIHWTVQITFLLLQKCKNPYCRKLENADKQNKTHHIPLIHRSPLWRLWHTYFWLLYTHTHTHTHARIFFLTKPRSYWAYYYSVCLFQLLPPFHFRKTSSNMQTTFGVRQSPLPPKVLYN